MTTEAKILPKLSLKGMKAQPAKNSVEADKPFDIATIYGIAQKAESITTTFGDSVRFAGSFKGCNLVTGETFRSGKVFLPGIVEEMLADAVADAPDGGVEFAFVIGVEHSEKGSMGYAYTVRPLTKIKESDALAHLDSLVESSLKALPAPAAEPSKKGGKK